MILIILVTILFLILPFSVMLWAVFPNNYTRNKKTSYKERFCILTILFSKVNFIVSLLLIPYSIHTLIELSVAQVKGFGILLATVLALLAIITLLSYLVWLVSYIYAIKFARKNGLFEDINYLHKYKIKSIDWLIK